MSTAAAWRIPIPASGDINDVMWDMRPGDYCGPIRGYTADKPAVFYVLPGSTWPETGAGFGHVVSPPHVFTEQVDGSLEIRESILHRGHKFEWHGYLDAGNVWRVA
jgi:hypothetical protein